MSKGEVEHYGVAGGGCNCGWKSPDPTVNFLRTQHMYEHNPKFRQLVDEYGWPKNS